MKNQWIVIGILVLIILAISAYWVTRPEEEEIPEEIKVHLILYGYHDEGSWDPQLYETLMEAVMESEHDFHVTISEDVKSEEAEEVLELAAEANDVVVAASVVYAGAVKTVAPRFPDVYFILCHTTIGSDPKTLISSTEFAPNVIAISPGNLANNYVLGALAAKMVGPDAKLGFIQHLDIPSATNRACVFRAGAQSVYPEMEVLRNVMGAFVAPVKCRDAISTMAVLGVEAILIDQDDTSGVLEAVEQGIYAMGVYRDLAGMAPDTIIGSSVWDWKIGFAPILDAIGDGQWEEFRAGNWVLELNLANGGQSLGTFGNMVTDELEAYANEVIEDINAGITEVPYIETW